MKVGDIMESNTPTTARRIAEAVIAFETKRTGRAPQAVSVVIGGDTLVVTLHGALSLAERALAASAHGADQIQEFHRELFNAAAAEFREEIRGITGVDVRESKAEVETSTGTVVQVFSTGTVVQVFLLANGVPSDAWSQETPINT
jgi:uncharacterized protein YbcI